MWLAAEVVSFATYPRELPETAGNIRPLCMYVRPSCEESFRPGLGKETGRSANG